MPDFNSPEQEWGGADPRGFESGDGTWFWSALEIGADKQLRLVVWQTTAAGAILSRWAESGITGQGGLLLQANGRLDAVGYLGQGNNQTRRAVPVPRWVSHARPSGGALSARYADALERLCKLLGI